MVLVVTPVIMSIQFVMSIKTRRISSFVRLLTLLSINERITTLLPLRSTTLLVFMRVYFFDLLWIDMESLLNIKRLKSHKIEAFHIKGLSISCENNDFHYST